MSGALDGTISSRGLRALGVVLLLLRTGCAETGIDGTMDKAMRKDIQQMGRRNNRPLSGPDKRDRRCGDRDEWVQRECPPECQQ